MTGYLYDADGTRLAKGSLQNMTSCDPTLNGFQTTSDFVLGPGGEQVTEMGMDPNLGVMAWQHTNVWAGGKLLATYDGATTTEVVNGVATVVANYGLHFYFDDPLGTRRVQTDYMGVVEKSCASLPFGDGESCAATPTEHLFTGKERDAESGNDYFEARYYSSSMGRFMSPDWSAKEEPVPYSKMDDPQTLNLYAYVRNNPLSRVDPDGHGDKNQTLQDDKKAAVDILKGNNHCSTFFDANLGGKPGSAAALLEGTTVQLDPKITSSTTAATTQETPTAPINVNPNGAVFQSSIVVTNTETHNVPAIRDLKLAPGTDFKGGEKKTGVAVVLHELAHHVPGLIPRDGSSVPNGMQQTIQNNQKIITECGEELNNVK
jgi:RHS repeat-associated protein